MEDNRMKRIGTEKDCPTESDKRYYRKHQTRMPYDVIHHHLGRALRRDYNICQTRDETHAECWG